MVNQREVGADTESFKSALKYILRQDPDVVLIGELRDLETIEAALTVAETGHLCFATLHTNSAVQTINRIVDVFPPYQQSQIRAAALLRARGRDVPDAAAAGQRAGSRARARGHGAERGDPEPDPRGQDPPDLLAMQVGQDKFGMQTMNQSLAALVSGADRWTTRWGGARTSDELRN